MEKKNIEKNTITEIVKSKNDKGIVEVMQSKEVQDIISKEMSDSKERGEELAFFLTDSLSKVFENAQKEASEIEKLFSEIVSEEEVKQELNDLFRIFSEQNNSTVNSSLRRLDDDLAQVSKPIKTLKNTLEKGSTLFGKIGNVLKGISDDDIIKNSLSGIQGRMQGIQNSLDKGTKQIDINQEALKKFIPKIAMRVAKLKGMGVALKKVSTKSDIPDKTKILLSDLSNNMESLSVSLVGDLQKLSVLVQINTNNRLILTTTKKKVLSKITSSLFVNYIAGTEKVIKNMANSIDDRLSMLDKENQKEVGHIMKMEEKQKGKVKQEMIDSLKDIEDLAISIEKHNKNMEKINQEIEKFLPDYKKRITQIEAKVYKGFNTTNNEVAQNILKNLVSEAKEFNNKYKIKK